jgi:hypothetical protein
MQKELLCLATKDCKETSPQATPRNPVPKGQLLPNQGVHNSKPKPRKRPTESSKNLKEPLKKLQEASKQEGKRQHQ